MFFVFVTLKSSNEFVQYFKTREEAKLFYDNASACRAKRWGTNGQVIERWTETKQTRS